MKIRNLKKLKWIMTMSSLSTEDEEHEYPIISWDGNKLLASAEWEYDNGLYTESGYYDFDIHWKDITRTLNMKKTDFYKRWYQPHITLYTGKCRKCGKEMSFEEFKSNGWNQCDECIYKDIETWDLEDEDD